jgi:hypothetical protein
LASRLRFLVLVGGMLLVILVLPGRSAIYSQDETPPPTGENNAMLVALPFGEPFDTADRWKATGIWRWSEDAGYEGGGWILDGTPRNTVSTLEYIPYIDLHGTLGAQIVFRQRGHMSISDLIALEISLDGGSTWFIIDSQGGLAPPDQPDAPPPTVASTSEAEITVPTPTVDDWIRREISLKDYRNQVIRLRFRVQTGLQFPSNGDTGPFVYQIDNLAIQYVNEVPSYATLIPGPHTLLGLHMIVGARGGPVLDFVKRLRDAGWPLGTIKGTTGTESILAEVHKESPETIIVYRSLETPRGMIDCPNSDQNPIAEADAWMAGLYPIWANVPADYYEIMNECFPPIEWLVPFTIEAMQQATAHGYCLLVFSFAAGNPEPYQYDDLVPVYDYAINHPCKAGRRHGVALHSYSGDPHRLVSESGIWLGLRYRLYYEQLLPVLPDATVIPVFLTETGPGDGRTSFACDTLARDMIQYTRQLEEDPYIQGFHLWNLGSPGFEWIDVTDCLPALGDALINYYTSK